MKDFHSLIEYKPELAELATFVPNKRTPIYNWFYYKEGFSKQLVEMLIKEFDVKSGQTVLDPFIGSGSTLLACKQNNINSIGLDVLPISVFASTVKTQDYDLEKLRLAKEKIIKTRFEIPSPEKIKEIIPPLFKRYFSKYALQDIVFLKRAIGQINSEKEKNFFIMSLINTALKVSYAWKDGAVLKVKKHPTPPMRKLFKRITENMIKDVKNSNEQREQASVMRSELSESERILSGSVEVKQSDARHIPLEDNSIDAVITSPPYYNNIDYTKVYEIENWFVKNILKNEPGLRSFLNSNETYFEDMQIVLEELYRVCKPSAKLAIVVGNGYDKINNKIVESDILLAKIAENIGFKVKKIIAVTERPALIERSKKVGQLRESIIIIRK